MTAVSAPKALPPMSQIAHGVMADTEADARVGYFPTRIQSQESSP